MDHFNSTVQDGALVSTRRGLQVTKTKHQGTRFVNSFAATPTTKAAKPSRERRDAGAAVDLGKPLVTRFRFVTKPKPKVRSSTASKAKAPKDDDEDRRQAKKVVRRQAATTPAGEALGPPDISRWHPKMWATHNNGVQVDGSEKSQELVHLYFLVVPTKMYPLEELLEFNPLRQNTFFDLVHRDLVTMHCIVMSASLIESVVLRGERCSNEVTYYIGKVCNMVNGKLQDQRGKIEQAVLECVVAMAICGVSRRSHSPLKSLIVGSNFPLRDWLTDSKTIIGRHDHWHLHMKGLRQMLEMVGGLRREMGYCLNKVRR
jgi:hypothetical protein